MIKTIGSVKLQLEPVDQYSVFQGVPVLHQSGGHCFVRWLGFAPESARDHHNGRGVKVRVEAILKEGESGEKTWGQGGYISGIAVERGVYVLYRETGRFRFI